MYPIYQEEDGIYRMIGLSVKPQQSLISENEFNFLKKKEKLSDEEKEKIKKKVVKPVPKGFICDDKLFEYIDGNFREK